jgi:hypothetical protein
MSDNLIAKAEYNWNENNEYVSVTVTLTDGTMHTTERMTEVGELLLKQSEATKMLEEVSGALDELVRK